MNFPAALKAFLRQDPNIIMVGEIRDFETGGIAIKAALTGHLVLSTLHTNDCPRHDHSDARHGARAVQRRLGAQPGVGSAPRSPDLQASAKSKRPTRRSTSRRHGRSGLGCQDTLYKGEGCDECGAIGYKGRCGFYEVMIMSTPLRRLIMNEMGTDELRELAARRGCSRFVRTGSRRSSRV